MILSSNVRRCLAALVLVLGVASHASAQTIWGIWNNAPGGQGLATFNAATPGVLNLVGLTGIPSTSFINSLDWTSSGQLFLATNAATNYFHSVNPATGQATVIGGAGLSAGDSLGDISWDHFNGRMLGIGTPGVAGAGARLYQINLNTGVATLLGPVAGMTEGFTVSLAVRPSDGRIFAHGIETDRWYSIDQNTLTATPLGLLGTNTNFGQGATFDPASGTLFHAMLDVDAGNRSRFATINTTTGAPTFIGNLGATISQVGDIAILIPEPASLSVLSLAGLALIRRR